MKQQKTHFHFFLLLVGCLFPLLFNTGCASSNLHQRPEWAKRSALPKELKKQYPPTRYLSQVVVGTGSTFKEAEKKAEEEAYRVFSSMIVSKVSSTYEKRSRILATRYGKTIQRRMKQYLKVVTKDILLAGLKKVISWDGYEKNKIYYFAAYVLDKEVAKRVLQERFRKVHNSLMAAWESVQRAQNRSDRDLAALETLKYILSFEVLKEQAAFFGITLTMKMDLGQWKQQCLRLLQESIEVLMQQGSQKELEDALALAQKSLEYYPFPAIDGKILEIKRRLPCIECGFSGKCVKCKGRRGFFYICPTCNGNQYISIYCPVCKGDGKRPCSRCQGVGTVSVPCQYCHERGRITCPTCKGKGYTIGNCRKCHGKGIISCTTCRGRGKVQKAKKVRQRCPRCYGKGIIGWHPCRRCGGKGKVRSPFVRNRWETCRTCRGKGKVPVTCTTCQGRKWIYRTSYVWETCRTCRGRGKLTCPQCHGRKRLKYKCVPPTSERVIGLFSRHKEYRYKYCNGTGTVPCPQCHGSLRVRVVCPDCQGMRRVGMCPKCQGSGRVTVPCPKCPPEHKGKIFKGCSHCKGSGVCPVCKGVGHRV